MLIQRQVTNRILDNARRIKKESLEIRHTCRNTRSVSLLLRNLLQEKRKSCPSGTLGTLQSKQSAEGHGMRNQTSTQSV